MSQIDWKRELKKVERQFDGLPPEPSAGERRAKHAAEQREQLRQKERSATIGAWARLSLVILLTVAINFWPYDRSCGFGLIAYMTAEALIVAGGLWVATIAWRERLPMTHGLSLLLVLAGLALLELQIMPRTGYAKVDAAWSCPSS